MLQRKQSNFGEVLVRLERDIERALPRAEAEKKQLLKAAAAGQAVFLGKRY